MTDVHKFGAICHAFKVSVRGKFAILHNFTFLSDWINLKVIFKIKKLHEKIFYLLLVIAREIFFAC